MAWVFRTRIQTRTPLARAARTLASTARIGRGLGADRSIRKSSSEALDIEEVSPVGERASEVGIEGGSRYASGPCTRMNLFTAVNVGLRTALETDDSAVSVTGHANELSSICSAISMSRLGRTGSDRGE